MMIVCHGKKTQKTKHSVWQCPFNGSYLEKALRLRLMPNFCNSTSWTFSLLWKVVPLWISVCYLGGPVTLLTPTKLWVPECSLTFPCGCPSSVFHCQLSSKLQSSFRQSLLVLVAGAVFQACSTTLLFIACHWMFKGNTDDTVKSPVS